jgi:hypothetical protein
MGDWYVRAQRGDWTGLKCDWADATEQTSKPEAGALLRFDNPDGGFGVGVLVEAEIVVTVRHQGRLIAAPRRALYSPRFYQLKCN